MQKHSSNEVPHRGITMHQMPVGGNFPGLVFAIGSALIFFFAIPALWYIVAAAAVVGVAIAGLLHILHRNRAGEIARLTIKL